MPKYFLLLSVVSVLFVSCSRKTVPPKSNNGTVVISNANTSHVNTPVKPTSPGEPVKKDSITSPTATANKKIWIILDKGGRLAVSKSQLPTDVSANIKSLPASQPLSAAYRNNLMTRYKTLLPLALYVSDTLAQKSGKGKYYKYRDKFWYWQKDDGVYYLDKIYYE